MELIESSLFLLYIILELLGFWILLSFYILLFFIKIKNRYVLIKVFSLILFIILIFPFFNGFIKGVLDYRNDKARIIIGDLDYRKKLDRNFRVKYTGRSCISDSYIESKILGNNIGVTYMINNFGYPKYTYLGFFPDKEESVKELKINGKNVKVKIDYENSNISFKLNNKNYKSYIYKGYYIRDKESITKQKVDLLEISNYIDLEIDDNGKNYTEARIAIKNNECIIFNQKENKKIFLIDAKKGLAFTEYRFN